MQYEKLSIGKANALFLYRNGGFSKEEFGSLNFSTRVGDDIENVNSNRKLLADKLIDNIDIEFSNWYWPIQNHTNNIVELIDNVPRTLPVLKFELPKTFWFKRPDKKYIQKAGEIFSIENDCDGVITKEVKTPCIIQTADCLPVAILCENKVAAIHAGWQGIKKGIVRKAFEYFKEEKEAGKKVTVFLGPCIRVESNEFSYKDAIDLENTLHYKIRNIIKNVSPDGQKCHIDLPLAIKQMSEMAGFEFVDSNVNTVESTDCFSYRRDAVTGRHALVVWLDE